ncbi:Hpt domain-containing protein [Shewanella waksmanii]|uniref:Hpt domain-containing protein n=1 Tax=Shewanella waksmanii TaxID=213783 RepID=UPI00049091D6|nr:Hpt domain-containing protein [Shewanella waksmanii]
MTPIESVILDRNILISLIGDDPQEIADFQHQFIAQAQQSLKKLAMDFNQADFNGVKQEAHFLKTSAKAIGALQVSDILQSIEHAAIAHDKATTKSLILSLKHALQSLIGAIQQ